MAFDWMGIVSKEQMGEFLSARLGLCLSKIEKRINPSYGTYFIIHFEDSDFEPIMFGKFGKLKTSFSDGKLLIQEDFDFLDKNSLFAQEYIAFINKQNKIDGKNRKINGKTYLTNYKEVYNNQNKEKGEN